MGFMTFNLIFKNSYQEYKFLISLLSIVTKVGTNSLFDFRIYSDNKIWLHMLWCLNFVWTKSNSDRYKFSFYISNPFRK